MDPINKAANSGIDALLGFEFQRNCALYLLLNDYEKFKERNFFICIEHHDDFLYCYRTNCHQLIEEVHAFQAKKLSGNVWSINERFSEILTKMLGVGIGLKSDPITKSKDYSHKLTFISNSNIELKYTPKKIEKTQGKKELIYTLNEQNCKCQYSTIPDEIKNKIKEKVITFCESNETVYHESELENLHIQWIDFPRTKKLQIDTLVGLMCRKFPHVFDPVAAVELLLSLFREVESTYNQGKIITLLDNSKRVEGNEIKLAIDIIENEQKTFDLWRNNSAVLSRTFRIPIGIQSNLENHIRNTFELLKDMNNNEHQIIKCFVRENDFSMDYFSYDEMFESYLYKIKETHTLRLSDIDIFFSTLCSFVEYHGKAL